MLGSLLVGPAIDGMQLNAMAIAKHFILNNQETDRSGVNELVDEQTIMELYAPPFAEAARHKRRVRKVTAWTGMSRRASMMGKWKPRTRAGRSAFSKSSLGSPPSNSLPVRYQA